MYHNAENEFSIAEAEALTALHNVRFATDARNQIHGSSEEMMIAELELDKAIQLAKKTNNTVKKFYQAFQVTKVEFELYYDEEMKAMKIYNDLM